MVSLVLSCGGCCLVLVGERLSTLLSDPSPGHSILPRSVWITPGGALFGAFAFTGGFCSTTIPFQFTRSPYFTHTYYTPWFLLVR